MARFKEMAEAVKAEAKPKSKDALDAVSALVKGGMSKHACEATCAACDAMAAADIQSEPTSIVAAGVGGEWVQMRWDGDSGNVAYSAVPEDQGPVVVTARLTFKGHGDAVAALRTLLAIEATGAAWAAKPVAEAAELTPAVAVAAGP